jgi:hypothetical protein
MVLAQETMLRRGAEMLYEQHRVLQPQADGQKEAG